MKNRTIEFMNALFCILLVVAAILISVEANATGTPKPQEQEQKQHQGQEQIQDQHQDQAQHQTAITGDMANEQSVTFKDRAQASSAIAPGTFSSNPCSLGGSAAVSVPKLSIGGGKNKVDGECEKRETARLLGALGERELAVMLLCTTDAATVLGDNCKPNVDLQNENQELRERVQFLLNERTADRKACEAAKDRIGETYEKQCGYKK